MSMQSVILLVAMAAAAVGCDNLAGLCGNTMVRRSLSPDGAREADDLYFIAD